MNVEIKGTTGTSPDPIYTAWYTNARDLLYKPMHAPIAVRSRAGTQCFGNVSVVAAGEHDARGQKIRMRLGGSANMRETFPEKPKGMHHDTYMRLFWEHHEAAMKHLAYMCE
jgi:hypothetical protein